MSQFVPLTGIARQASEGEVLEAKRRVEYRTLPTRKWLTRCQSKRVPFTWTINPYRGCEYGCKYCYARFTHEFLERRDPKSFETEIYAKDWDYASFVRELRSVKEGDWIGIGTGTDPYQPAERRFGRTASTLEALTCLKNASIGITTKSNLVRRDAEILRTLGKASSVGVCLTITTLDAALARKMEPFAPHPELRLEAVRALADAGIRVGVIASPVLPLITDSQQSLRAIATAAAAAGASSFGAAVLFLKPSTQRVFFPFLREEYPKLVERYEKQYRSGAFLKGEYPDYVSRVVRTIRSEIPFHSNRAPVVKPPQPGGQLTLF
ncbi:MAG: SPL family radical SAM protein [Bryobacteraceae bacterium]